MLSRGFSSESLMMEPNEILHCSLWLCQLELLSAGNRCAKTILSFTRVLMHQLVRTRHIPAADGNFSHQTRCTRYYNEGRREAFSRAKVNISVKMYLTSHFFPISD